MFDTKQKQKTTLYVGRTRSRARVWVDIELRTRGDGSGYRTVEHERIEEYLELGIMGSVVERGARTMSAGGQICDAVADVVDFSGSSFTPVLRDTLLEIWGRWHLNGLTAGCAHMVLPEDTRYEARQGITCLAGSGYVYGHSWLVDVLPERVERQVLGFMALAPGNVPDYV